jgi:oligopeptide transport system substrate-binding protein
MRALLPLLLISLGASAETLRMHLPSPVTDLDWTGGLKMSNAPLVVNLQVGLYGVDPKSKKAEPLIAESVIKSKDLKTYTFKIRKNAKWSDGKPVYAKDFVDAWQRVLSPQSSSIYYYYLYDILNAREYHEKKTASFEEVGVKSKDDSTLVVQFNTPQTNWELKTAFWPFFPIRKDMIEKLGNKWWQAGALVSTGPYLLQSMEQGKKATLVFNPHFHSRKSNVDRIEIDFVSDRKTVLERYRNQTYPFIQDVNETKLFKDREFKEIPLLRHHALVINAGRFPMSNRKFRKAIVVSINTNDLIDPAEVNLTRAESLVPDSLLKTKEHTALPFQPELGREFLRNSGIVIDKSIKINIMTGMGELSQSIGKKIANAIEKNLGLSVTSIGLSPKEFETYGNLGDYSMTLVTWTAKVPEARDFLLPYSNEFLSNNKTRHVIPGFDAAVKSDNIEYALQIVSREETVIQPLFFERIGYLSRSTISGLQFDHMGLPILRNVQLRKK